MSKKGRVKSGGQGGPPAANKWEAGIVGGQLCDVSLRKRPSIGCKTCILWQDEKGFSARWKYINKLILLILSCKKSTSIHIIIRKLDPFDRFLSSLILKL